jgi:hypothetical protein
MYFAILQSTPTWLPFEAINLTTDLPRTGIVFSQVVVSYKKSTATSFTTKTLVTGDFREIGNGIYEISFSAAELNTLGSFLYLVQGGGTLPAPAIRQYFGQAVIQAAAAYTPGAITLSTNALTGNLVDIQGQPLAGETVCARVLVVPTLFGTTPNRGGIGSDLVSAQTDASGFFVLEVLQGSVIDITIPAVSYRRTLTVPAHSTDKLFDLP